MIENVQFIRIKNGWIVTVRDKGMVKECIEDVFLADKEEIISWVKENLR